MPRVPRAKTLADESKAWELSQQGFTLREIGEKLHIDYTTVSKMLKRISCRILDELRDKESSRLVKILERYEYIYREAMLGYQESKKPEYEITVEEGRQGHFKGEIIEYGPITKKRKKERVPNPAFLVTATDALNRQVELLGVIEEKQANVETDNGESKTVWDTPGFAKGMLVDMLEVVLEKKHREKLANDPAYREQCESEDEGTN